MKFCQFGQKYGRAQEHVVFLCDVSGSMAQTDYSPSRLVACKRALKELYAVKAREAPEDWVSIVSFGSDAKVVQPLVQVQGSEELVYSKIDRLKIRGSTNMAAGLGSSISVLASGGSSVFRDIVRLISSGRKPESASVKRIICCTDGEFDCLPSARRLFTKAKSAGVIIDVVGIAGSRTASGFSEEQCLEMASDDPTSSNGKRYVFVKYTQELVRELKTRANLIRKSA